MNKIAKLKQFKYRLILGSASPRRKQLLGDLGFAFHTQAIAADESDWPAELKAEEIALFLAEKKAGAFPRKLENDELLITADTIVWRDNKIYNKPAGYSEARQMLRSLSDGQHDVFTGVCLRSAEKEVTFYGASRVFFRKLDEDEIDYYLENYRPYDKAGAYGVQDWLGYVGIEKIEGSFYNVMGLPVRELYEALLNF